MREPIPFAIVLLVMFGHNIIILEHHGHWVMSSKVDLIEGMVDRQGSKGMLEVVLLCV